MRVYVEFKNGSKPRIFKAPKWDAKCDEFLPRLRLYNDKGEVVVIIPIENILYWEVLDESNN